MRSKLPRSFLPKYRRRRRPTVPDASGVVRGRSRFLLHEEQQAWIDRLGAKLPPRERGLPMSYVLAAGFAFLGIGPDMRDRLPNFSGSRPRGRMSHRLLDTPHTADWDMDPSESKQLEERFRAAGMSIIDVSERLAREE